MQGSCPRKKATELTGLNNQKESLYALWISRALTTASTFFALFIFASKQNTNQNKGFPNITASGSLRVGNGDLNLNTGLDADGGLFFEEKKEEEKKKKKKKMAAISPLVTSGDKMGEVGSLQSASRSQRGCAGR